MRVGHSGVRCARDQQAVLPSTASVEMIVLAVFNRQNEIWKNNPLTMQRSGRQGSRISGTVRKPSIRSAEAEERRRVHGVQDAGSALRAPARTREPSWEITQNVTGYHYLGLEIRLFCWYKYSKALCDAATIMYNSPVARQR